MIAFFLETSFVFVFFFSLSLCEFGREWQACKYVIPFGFFCFGAGVFVISQSLDFKLWLLSFYEETREPCYGVRGEMIQCHAVCVCNYGTLLLLLLFFSFLLSFLVYSIFFFFLYVNVIATSPTNESSWFIFTCIFVGYSVRERESMGCFIHSKFVSNVILCDNMGVSDQLIKMLFWCDLVRGMFCYVWFWFIWNYCHSLYQSNYLNKNL